MLRERIPAPLAAAWRRGQAGWPSAFVVVQVPNLPLLVALAASVVARLTSGLAAGYAEAVGRLAFGVFAYLELTDGANWFRRLLGAAVAAWLVVRLGHDLR